MSSLPDGFTERAAQPEESAVVADGDRGRRRHRARARGGVRGSLGSRSQPFDEFRRKELGELLLRTAFAEFARRGETRVRLGVDTENPTGATRLYDRVGMTVAFQANVFRKELR